MPNMRLRQLNKLKDIAPHTIDTMTSYSLTNRSNLASTFYILLSHPRNSKQKLVQCEQLNFGMKWVSITVGTGIE